MAENFLELSCTTENAPGLQCSPSKRARLKTCLKEFDGRTPKLVRLDNEDEGLADPRDTQRTMATPGNP